MAFAPQLALSQRIESIIDNIELVRAELSYPASDPASGLAVPKVPIGTVERVKYSVDQFRLFLWAYLDTRAQGGYDPAERMQRIRMEAAADMLRMLVSDFRTAGVPSTTEAVRLGEQLRAVASLMVDLPSQRPS